MSNLKPNKKSKSIKSQVKLVRSPYPAQYLNFVLADNKLVIHDT